MKFWCIYEFLVSGCCIHGVGLGWVCRLAVACWGCGDSWKYAIFTIKKYMSTYYLVDWQMSRQRNRYVQRFRRCRDGFGAVGRVWDRWKADQGRSCLLSPESGSYQQVWQRVIIFYVIQPKRYARERIACDKLTALYLMAQNGNSGFCILKRSSFHVNRSADICQLMLGQMGNSLSRLCLWIQLNAFELFLFLFKSFLISIKPYLFVWLNFWQENVGFHYYRYYLWLKVNYLNEYLD